RDEMRDALKAEILLFNVESVGELRALDEVAREVGTRAPVALRVNPDVDPQTHKYIATGLKSAKFGIPHTQALAAYEEAAGLRGIQVVGADMHIGSQLTKALPLGDAVARVAALVKQLRERGVEITTIDVGGGLGIRYRHETPPTHAEYATVLLPALKELGVTVLLEPGRSIVGNAGALLTRVLYHKPTDAKTFVVVDAAMNDLVRPAFYDSYHAIVPVAEARAGVPVETADVVGPRWPRPSCARWSSSTWPTVPTVSSPAAPPGRAPHSRTTSTSASSRSCSTPYASTSRSSRAPARTPLRKRST